MVLDDILFDVNQLLIKESLEYANGLYDKDPEIFEEITHISKRLEQLHTKLDVHGFGGFEKINTWRFEENWKPKKL